MSSHEDKHFIIVAYYFPPLGLAGTARPLAMANFFAARGYRTSVVTVKPIDYPAYDQSQLDSLHPAVKVYRAGSSDPARLRKLLPIIPSTKSIKAVVGAKAGHSIFPDSKVGFVKPALKAIKKIITPDAMNYVITTSPPVSIHRIGVELSRIDNLIWIADFRDIWGPVAIAEMSEGDARKAESYLESIVSKSKLVIATSPKTLEYLKNRGLQSGSSYFLPNGYQEEDFNTPVEEKRQSLGLLGTLNYLMGVEKLFEWLSKYREGNPQHDLGIWHTGYEDLAGLPEMLVRYNLSGQFHSTGFLPHGESVHDIRRNFANVITLTDKSDTSFIVPSKLFELLRAEPPVIAVLPKGNAARSLLESRSFERVYVVDSFEEFQSAIKKIRDGETANREHAKRKGVERFERRSQLGEFLTRLERVSV